MAESGLTPYKDGELVIQSKAREAGEARPAEGTHEEAQDEKEESPNVPEPAAPAV